MTHRKYMTLCERQSSNWLRLCADNPSDHMTPFHVAIIRIVLRRRGASK